jgi:DNA-binding transcriptional regulator YhcF (GntR family)
MKSRVFDLIDIDEFSAVPKYMQLARSIVGGIEVGKIKRFDVLPSINELSFEYNISRVTAEKGYKYLRKIGVLEAVPGKGFFVKSVEVCQNLKIFLLFNKLSAHKKIIYDSFIDTLGTSATVDLHIYNNDYTSFKKQVLSNSEDYSFYVIIPHFLDNCRYASAIINGIPKDKLVLLDKRMNEVTGEYAAVYENFEVDIFNALEKALERLRKYNTLKIIFPKNSYFPEEILYGFLAFCDKYQFTSKIVDDISGESISKGEVYINLMEDDLVTLIERISLLELEVGKDVGVISYNETPLKKIILNGITTISTDFAQMGKMAAQLILNHSHQQIEVPFKLTLRNSL